MEGGLGPLPKDVTDFDDPLWKASSSLGNGEVGWWESVGGMGGWEGEGTVVDM